MSFFKTKNLVLVLTLTSLVGCNKELKGTIILTQQNPLRLKTAAAAFVNLGNEEPVSVTLATKGWFFDSTLLVKSVQGVSKIMIPKAAYLSKKTFSLSAGTTGQTYDIKGYETSDFVKAWEERGTDECDLGGDCGHFQNTYNTKGQVSGMYWVPATCWGSHNVIWHKELYHEGYKIEFQPAGYFLSYPTPKIKQAVAEVLSQCR